jgi:hypothetical protein
MSVQTSKHSAGIEVILEPGLPPSFGFPADWESARWL